MPPALHTDSGLFKKKCTANEGEEFGNMGIGEYERKGSGFSNYTWRIWLVGLVQKEYETF